MVKPLDKKLLRDFKRLWAQALAIALVASVGVMTLLLGVGTYRSLDETQQTYYERYSFADIFASASRVPNHVLEKIISINGVSRAEARIMQSAVLDIKGMDEPAKGLILSIPDIGEAQLNRLFVQKGHLPQLTHAGEVAVSKAFADANGFKIGDDLAAIMGGIKRKLTISAIVLSPEFIYSIGAGEIMPDDKRFGIIWMRYSDVAASYNLVGAFNNVSLALNKQANSIDVKDRLDDILKPFGGSGSYGRSEQLSNAFIDSELTSLRAMSYILPPIFLVVAAFLVNMTLARLITLEREQIGLLKAIGYSSWTISWHYVKLALLIAFVGTIIGWGFGAWAGRALAGVYAEYFKFPFLLFHDRADVYAISALAAVASAVLGSLQAVRATNKLSPAVAMSPPAPPVYKKFILERLGISRLLPQGLNMAIRNLVRRPTRASLTTLGISLSTGLLISGLFTLDALEYMIDATYFRADRQQASLYFARPISPSGMEEVARLPGVLKVEPFRAVAVKLSNSIYEKRVSLIGKPAKTDLSRVIDLDLDPIILPKTGILLSKVLADILHVKVGDEIYVEILDGRSKTIRLPVSQIVQQFIGLGAYMEIKALNRVLGEGSMASGAYLQFDSNERKSLYDKVKSTPIVAGISMQRKSLEMIRETIGQSMGISQAVYVFLAVIIVFGVVYNSMRIQLSERARELASLRVLGFTKIEVSIILLSELAIITAFAIPLGWLVGYGMAMAITEGFQSELFSFPMMIARKTYVYAALIVLGATVISAWFVQRRVANLDMIEVLKTRD
jgi:putative ABC transport system permease protein